MRIPTAIAIVSVASLMFWAALNRPLDAPDWQGKFAGVSYNPSGIYDLAQLEAIPEERIREDLTFLRDWTKEVRTYSVDRGLDAVPRIAREVGDLQVSLGIWLSDDTAYNEAELARAIPLINAYPDVIRRVFVGNEVILREELSADAVVAYLRRVRDAVPDSVEVGYADVWSTWERFPELAEASDFVGAHLLPYWEGVSARDGESYIRTRMKHLKKSFPGHEIVIAETGWPSEGRAKRDSVASPETEAYFLRHFLHLAADRGYDYYIIEAFDQPWKQAQEGAVGAYWGIFDAAGEPKLSLVGKLTSNPDWYLFASVAISLVITLCLLVMRRLPRMLIPGYLAVGVAIGVVASQSLVIFDTWTLQYFGWSTLISAVLIVPVLLCAATLLLTETIEFALSLWRVRQVPDSSEPDGTCPFVSIHLPTHNEPPLMVMQTLNALSRLDYPNFEVIVLDNNTRDDSLWCPVQSHCRVLGPQFRFLHVDDMAGFKAGALNLALELTSASAKFIAVIDSDYQVDADWLRKAIPLLQDPEVALVQCPQDYRDANASAFKRWISQEYAGFFRIGMVERNEHNAIIQHGTMCLIRREALEAVGGWATWSITEDTELGLRLFEAGYRANYIPGSLGKGLMPDTFDAYRKQRHRWVYGGMQILKRYAASFFLGRAGKSGVGLTQAQRYYFVAGWLPWLSDGLSVIFVGMAIIWSLLAATLPALFSFPPAVLSLVVVGLFVMKITKALWLHYVKVNASAGAALAAALVGLSLSYSVGRAVISGLLTANQPFLRTPKCETPNRALTAFRGAASEVAFLLSLLVAIATVILGTGAHDPAEIAWIAALTVMSMPFAATLIVVLASSWSVESAVTFTQDVASPAGETGPTDVDLAA
jgi:exo-beta-1,3-glucanase (GH17 family)/cellulose synthase/poly-beta-1,6-N-acetylglucosamine synthase-like glycosyltransferase